MIKLTTKSKDKLFVIGQYKAEIEGHTYEGLKYKRTLQIRESIESRTDEGMSEYDKVFKVEDVEDTIQIKLGAATYKRVVIIRKWIDRECVVEKVRRNSPWIHARSFICCQSASMTHPEMTVSKKWAEETFVMTGLLIERINTAFPTNSIPLIFNYPTKPDGEAEGSMIEFRDEAGRFPILEDARSAD